MLASALALTAASQGLVLSQGYTAAPVARASTPTMAGGLYPKGPFGDYAQVGETEGWIGDRSQGTQIKAFEAGEDYLFFQGPSPKTAIQEDLPGLFTAVRLCRPHPPTTRSVRSTCRPHSLMRVSGGVLQENLSEASISPVQIAVTVVGVGTFATLVPVLLS